MKSCSWPGGEEGCGRGDKEEEEEVRRRVRQPAAITADAERKALPQRQEKKGGGGARDWEGETSQMRTKAQVEKRTSVRLAERKSEKKNWSERERILGEFPVCLNIT